jgi:hypothetical protein
MEKIRYFTILGERCTGTNFVQHAIEKNMNITYVKGEKHFFGNREFRQSSSLPKTKEEIDFDRFDAISPDELLVICMIRHPIDWIDSFLKNPHHVPPENICLVRSFLSNEWYSVYKDGIRANTEIMEDRNWKTKERYKNVFEMRTMKSAYLLDEVPKQYPHTYFLRYEDARDDYEATLNTIADRFQLTRKTNSLVRIEKYKGTFREKYTKKPIRLPPETQDLIWSNVDKEMERRMGYTQST